MRNPAVRFLGILLISTVAGLQSLISPTLLHGTEGHTGEVAATNGKQKVRTFRINIQRLQEGIASQRELFTEALNRERNLLEELEEIDKRLAEQTSKLKDMDERKAAQQAVIDQKVQELTMVRAEQEKVQRHLQKRITSYYKMGNIGLLNVTFSAQTLPELLKFHDAYQALIAYDQNVIAIYRRSIKSLEQATKRLNLEKNVLTDFIARAVAEQEIVDATKKEKENLLRHIRTQSKLHKQAIVEMEKAAAELSSSLLALKTKEQKNEQVFLEKKGRLPSPVAGVVVAIFRQDVTNSLGITKKTDGIAIKAPNGSKVRAIFPGTVVFAGYLRGYGNTIIVHHGFQYYSITSRVEKIIAGKDNIVETGSVLGETGETATLMEEGTYFEIRHGSTSLDPMHWLAPDGLQQREDLPSQ